MHVQVGPLVAATGGAAEVLAATAAAGTGRAAQWVAALGGEALHATPLRCCRS